MAEDPSRIGVLSVHSSKETKAILNAIEALGHEPVWLHETNTSVRIEDDTLTFEPDVDIVLNRLLISQARYPTELLGLAAVYETTIPVLNEANAALRAVHKFASAARLVDAGLPVPDAYLGLDLVDVDDARDRFGETAVHKLSIGTHGDRTVLLDRDDRLDPLALDRQSFLQAFVDTGRSEAHDYRVYVVDDEVLGTMRRTAREGEFRTNVAEGATVSDASDEVPDRVKTLAIEATDAIGLDYSGVDIINTGDDWYVLEVNPTAGFRGFFEATGVCPAPYIASLGLDRLGLAYDETTVAELAETFDDSPPSSFPAAEHIDQRERGTIGYTERVTVTGTSGTATALAKSDTGAKRTSIDLALAAEIGVGPIKRQTRVKSGLRPGSKARPVVDILVGVDDEWYTVTASVEDRSHMGYQVLLGRDILQHYHVDVTQEVAEE